MPKKIREKIKIAYIMPTLDRGGAERFLVDLLLNLDREAFDPSLILFKRGGEWLAELSAANIPVIVLKKKHKLDLFNFCKILAALKKINPQIVHTQLGGNIYGRLAAKLLKIPVILSTEQNVHPNEKRIFNILKKITNSWSDKIVAISQAVQADAIIRYQIDPGKMIIIPNGLEVDKFSFLDKRHDKESLLVFGTIGRLSPQKGHSILINAWKSLKNNNLKCLIAGAGPLAKQLQEQINEAGLTNKIKLVGPISNIPAFLDSLDAFVFPSLWEGQGIAVLEAGLAGLPIIASATGGLTEIINADSGFLVPAGDAKALAEKIDWLAANWHNPEVRAKVEKLRERIRSNFDIKKITADYEALYQELLRRKGVI